MDVEYEEKYHLLEKKQWWFRARRDAIRKLLKGINKNVYILDVGCSSGILLEELKQMGYKNLYGIDVSQKAVDASVAKGFKNCSIMNGENPTFDMSFFDLIISSDSLEHMEYDETALKNWYELLKPGGRLIVFVPAFMSLWSLHDVVNQHYRRYTKNELKEKIGKAGFNIITSGYWNFILFFPVGLMRRIKNSRKNSKQSDDLSNTSPFLNTILYNWMKFENLIFHHLGFPLGVSTFCYAFKPENE